ncbi:hypothetical protein EIN_526160 [Entamoeba invadens IP1]|uniref:F-box domain-containing protein n=1 Tax=Entamoeba invadens IP1 TaxID=370355 RepID=A0A0A1U8Z0_ENTIV|nr:hypothetical protein EIN_526160 [Entamoeba invadens IP1]ELP89601.1 hypothetical protein EIN_526160 [Entamoeba invadens IP1]|eukprot:XP_004256372.1 hypothetical protein EIN_526160 [Entamoeba invadens IP1]
MSTEQLTQKKRLEPFYLMNVVLYIDSFNTLQKFHMVSKATNQAIISLKTNPELGQSSIRIAIAYNGFNKLKLIKKELNIFTGIETLNLPSDILTQLDSSTYNQVELIQVNKYIQLMDKDNTTGKQQILKDLAPKLCKVAFDVMNAEFLLSTTFEKLREVTINVALFTITEDSITKYLEFIKETKCIKKATIIFNGNKVVAISKFLENYKSEVLAVHLQCFMLYELDPSRLLEMADKTDFPVAVWDTTVCKLENWMLDKRIVVLPVVHNRMHVTSAMENSPLYKQFKEKYLIQLN